MNVRRLSRVLVAVFAAAFIAIPGAYAARGNLVQIDGKLVPPSQLLEAQLAAGHDPSTRLVAIGGSLVAPSQVSAWQSNAARGTASSASGGSSSSNVETAVIAASAALASMVLLGSSLLIVRRRRMLAPA